MLREQFMEEVETWAGKVQEEVERQGREITSLRKDMEISISELSIGLAKCRGDMDRGLVQVRVLVQERQKQLQKALERLSGQVTDMSKEWGKDIARILNISKENAASVDLRLAALIVQNDSEHTHLQSLITKTKTQKTVLMIAMKSMETQMAQIHIPGEGSDSPSIPEPVRLPSIYLGRMLMYRCRIQS